MDRKQIRKSKKEISAGRKELGQDLDRQNAAIKNAERDIAILVEKIKVAEIELFELEKNLNALKFGEIESDQKYIQLVADQEEKVEDLKRRIPYLKRSKIEAEEILKKLKMNMIN